MTLRPLLWPALALAVAAPALSAPPPAAGIHLRVSQGNLPAVTMVPRGSGKTDVTLDADKAPTRALLRVLLRRADVSYVFGPYVGGTVTASLHNVPFDTALNTLLAANQPPLVKRMDNGVYVIRAAHPPASSMPRPVSRYGRRRR